MLLAEDFAVEICSEVALFCEVFLSGAAQLRLVVGYHEVDVEQKSYENGQ